MANSRNIGGLYSELSLKDANFRQGLKNASKELRTFSKSGLGAVGGAIGGALSGALGGAALIAGTKSTLRHVDELSDLSAQTGIAIGSMMKLQLAYKDGGRAAEMTGKDIGKMQKTIVAANKNPSGKNDPFRELGISVRKLHDMDPAAQFTEIGEAIMRIANPAERTAKAMAIFGKGGMGLTTVFPGMKDAEKALGGMPALAQKFGGAMNEANDTLGHLPLKSQQFFMGFTSGIIGTLLPGLRDIDNYDFTNIGKSLGDELSMALDGIKDGSTFEIWGMKGIREIMKVGDFIGNVLAATINSALDGGAWEVWGLKAQKAILGIYKSDAFISMAASFGAIMKGFEAPKPGEKFSYQKSKDEYYNAGQQMMGDPAKKKELEDKIKALEKKGGTFGAAAAKYFAGREGDPMIDDLNKNIATLQKQQERKHAIRQEEAAKVGVDPEAEKKKDLKLGGLPPQVKMEVDSYMKRGLSLGGGMTSKEDKKLDLMNKIHALLAKGLVSDKPFVWP